MSGWLLDTNVVSELRKTRPDHRVKAWSDAQVSDRLFLSTVTLAEIRFGIERKAEKYSVSGVALLSDRETTILYLYNSSQYGITRVCPTSALGMAVRNGSHAR
ncbi:MAG: PIN domain-containing protein, partial [Acidobacteria bacterium]|nr:PIN domain-containing protein [Acidobacteriota bacterium]